MAAKTRSAFAVCTVLILGGCNPFSQACEPDALVKSYLTTEPAWKIVTPDDLSSGGDFGWHIENSEKCPGLVSFKPDGGKVNAAALLLFEKRGDKIFQKLVVVKKDAKGFVVETLIEPLEVNSALFLRTVPPGTYEDVDTGRTVAIAHEAIALDAGEEGAIIYYRKGGKYRSLFTWKFVKPGAFSFE